MYGEEKHFHQIELMEEKYFDIVIALDCIHEMNKKTVKFYMKNIDKISKTIPEKMLTSDDERDGLMLKK